MADIQDLERRYARIPQSMRATPHWICFKSSNRNGKEKKIPISPFLKDGKFVRALPNDSSAWGDFKGALAFCSDNGLDGLGFELGETGMFAIDIENGGKMSQADFQDMANEFVKRLDSYCEWNVSKNGIHIFCYGKLPEGNLESADVKAYAGQRFFAMTGNAIGNRTVAERSAEIVPLWERYLRNAETSNPKTTAPEATDSAVVDAGCANPKTGAKFFRLMNGDASDYVNQSEAIRALCNFLAFYARGNEEQIDRIFRSSALYDPSWDAPEAGKTHGYFVVQSAIDACATLKLTPMVTKSEPRTFTPDMNVDEDGDPIFRISETYRPGDKKYTLDDTGNAKRFYDCFGENFHWNVDHKRFMFWTGKTWVYDNLNYVRKFANKLIEILREESVQMRHKAEEEPDENRRKILKGMAQSYADNVKRLSGKGGKDAMLAELCALGKMPISTNSFDLDPYRINTDSGIVDLRTGEILPFDKNAMFATNTKVKVSYETPEAWLGMLRSMFANMGKETAEQVIECFQRCLGYSLTGLSSEQVMFLLHGDGSNGKSTLSSAIRSVLGDYYGSIDSEQLMASSKNQTVAIQNTFAELEKTRFLSSQETDKGSRLSESTIKKITGSTDIQAQRKYGNPYIFVPVFKLWMETNNLPIIRGKDYGIWRRIFLFPFDRKFKEEEKDKTLPDRLAKEYDRILGWCIQGAVKYLADRDLRQPEYLKDALMLYKDAMDGTAKFLHSECRIVENGMVAKTDLYKAYKNWAMNNNEYAEAESKFREEIVKKGFEIKRNEHDGSMYYTGLALNGDAETGISGFRETKINGFGGDF